MDPANPLAADSGHSLTTAAAAHERPRPAAPAPQALATQLAEIETVLGWLIERVETLVGHTGCPPASPQPRTIRDLLT